MVEENLIVEELFSHSGRKMSKLSTKIIANFEDEAYKEEE